MFTVHNFLKICVPFSSPKKTQKHQTCRYPGNRKNIFPWEASRKSATSSSNKGGSCTKPERKKGKIKHSRQHSCKERYVDCTENITEDLPKKGPSNAEGASPWEQPPCRRCCLHLWNQFMEIQKLINRKNHQKIIENRKIAGFMSKLGRNGQK